MAVSAFISGKLETDKEPYYILDPQHGKIKVFRQDYDRLKLKVGSLVSGEAFLYMDTSGATEETKIKGYFYMGQLQIVKEVKS